MARMPLGLLAAVGVAANLASFPEGAAWIPHFEVEQADSLVHQPPDTLRNTMVGRWLLQDADAQVCLHGFAMSR